MAVEPWMCCCQFCGKPFPPEPGMHWPYVFYCDDRCRNGAMGWSEADQARIDEMQRKYEAE
jgi:hypothetical protein